MPAWLILDRMSNALYCFDESNGSGVVSSFDMTETTLSQTGHAKTTGGDVHEWLFGGSDGDGFFPTTE